MFGLREWAVQASFLDKINARFCNNVYITNYMCKFDIYLDIIGWISNYTGVNRMYISSRNHHWLPPVQHYYTAHTPRGKKHTTH